MADFDAAEEARKAQEEICQLNMELENVSRQIEAAGEAISRLGGPGSGVEVQYWMAEKNRLWTKEHQLRAEKEQLRTEKERWLDLMRGFVFSGEFGRKRCPQNGISSERNLFNPLRASRQSRQARIFH